MNTRQSRIDIVNKIISKVTEVSGFLKPEKKGQGEIIMKKGRLYYIDHYNGKHIYMHQWPGHGFRGFSSGGTLKDMIFREFKLFIMGHSISEKSTHLNCWHWHIKDTPKAKELKKFAQKIGYLS